MSADVTRATVGGGRRTGQRVRSKFFAYSATMILIAVFIGFSKTFYLRPLSGVRDMLGQRLPPLLVMIHGVLLSIWFSLLCLQAWLGALRRIELHRRLGAWGVFVAALVITSSLAVTYQFVPRGLEAGRAPAQIASILLSNALSLALFAVLVALAVRWRRNSEVHKRLMLCASLAILAPAFASGNVPGDRPLGPFLHPLLPDGPLGQPFMAATVVAIATMAIHDFATLRRISAATAFGGVALIAKQSIVQAAGHAVQLEVLLRWLN